jgi:hypothetical protein
MQLLSGGKLGSLLKGERRRGVLLLVSFNMHRPGGRTSYGGLGGRKRRSARCLQVACRGLRLKGKVKARLLLRNNWEVH